MNFFIWTNPEYVILNYALQGLGLLAALRAVSASNPVSSILWLILVFLSFACSVIYLGAEFLGLVLLVVYVGAIAVLFLFVVMMLNVRFVELNSKFLTYFPIAGVLVSLLMIFLSSVVYPGFSAFYQPRYGQGWLVNLNNLSNIETLGHALYTYFAPLFLLASFILLVAMIGSIMLTLQRTSNVKRQVISQQLSHTFTTQLDLKN